MMVRLTGFKRCFKAEKFSRRPNYQKLHVVVMNAQTGKQNTYSLKKLPEFVDEGITSDAAARMNTIFWCISVWILESVFWSDRNY